MNWMWRSGNVLTRKINVPNRKDDIFGSIGLVFLGLQCCNSEMLNRLSALLSILTVNMCLFPLFLFYDKANIFGFQTVGLPKQAIWKCHSDSEMDLLLLLSNSDCPLNPNTSMDNFQNVPLSVIITPVCQEQMEMSSDGVIEWQVHRWRKSGSMSSKLTVFFLTFIYRGSVHWKCCSLFRNAVMTFTQLHIFTHGSCSVQPQSGLPAAEQLGLSSRTLHLSGGNEGRASITYHFTGKTPFPNL